jgi:adenosylhomocysteinase
MRATGDAESGKKKIEWAQNLMPVLRGIASEFSLNKLLNDVVIAATLHVTKETGVLVRALRSGGAEVILTASNPLSTDDDVAAALSAEGTAVKAWRGMGSKEYVEALDWAHSHAPQLIIDDGADSIVRIHETGRGLENVLAGLEETTTGVMRVKALERDRKLRFPVIAVNQANTKRLFDNVYGTGQSSFDGIMRATSMMIAGRCVVVAGFGPVGRGIAMRARGLGARVVVTEVEPVRALEAHMNGYEVMPMREASRVGDIFITATGDIKVITLDNIKTMKDGAVLANSGHFDVEVDVAALYAVSTSRREIRPGLEELTLPNGKKVFLLGQGRLVNLVCAEGHPPDVMDMSFANQALCAKYVLEERPKAPAVLNVPEAIDDEVATRKLKAVGVNIDELTVEQEKYLKSWRI